MAFKRNCLGTSASWGDTGKRLTFVFRSALRFQAIDKQFSPAKRRLQARCYQQRQQPPYVATEGPAGHEAACEGRK